MDHVGINNILGMTVQTNNDMRRGGQADPAMGPRPPYTSRQSTATTTSDGSCSMLSADRTTILTQSTAPTSPDIGSPMSMKKAWLSPAHGKLQGIMEPVAETAEGSSMGSRSRRASVELARGKSVKDRVGIWENAAGPSTAPSLSTTPLKLANKTTATPSPAPAKARRVPVPLTEPSRTPYRLNSPPRAVPSELKRGTGSAKKMIQQWEHGASPARTPIPSQPKRVFSSDYLNGKPLPVPSATRATPVKSPSRQFLATPTRDFTPSSSPRKGKGKSPIKDMLDRFGGGIKDVGRKIKGKGRSPSVISPLASREDLHFWEEPKYGSSGLPGGIVFSDRMGDQEMASNVIKSSTCVYLIPTPCSSVAQWGSWLTSYAALTPTHLQITYCPVFGEPKSGNSTPRRVLSGTGAGTSIAYSAIPLPAPAQQPDVELAMKDCVEIRSLRREEIKGRGIPGAPEGIGTEVLEMVWSDGTRRYFGVEGVGGRLGWVSAVWDVILSSKPSGTTAVLPPPSPVQLAKNTSLRSVEPLSSARHSISSAEPNPELTAFRDRIAVMEGKSASPLVPVLPEASGMAQWDEQPRVDQDRQSQYISEPDVGTPTESHEARLRESVTQMFLSPLPDAYEPPTERQEASIDKVAQWQQPGTHHLSVFGRRGPAFPPTEVDLRKTDTLLSFDPNDLNPSRSASQVRRVDNARESEPARLPAVDELSDSVMQPPTHISHVTFPKPAIGPYRMGQPLETHPELSESSSIHSQRSAGQSTSGSTKSSATIRTPMTEQGGMYGPSIAGSEATMVSHLEQHTAQHELLSGQVDGVHGDVKRVMGALTTLVAGQAASTMPDKLNDKLSTLALDVKALENALNLSSLASRGPPQLDALDDRVPELHRKLDGIAKLCEDLLSRGTAPAVNPSAAMLRDPSNRSTKSQSVSMKRGSSLGVTVDPKEEQEAGEEVAAIMADLTGGSSGSVRPGGIQVLHNSNPTSPIVTSPTTSKAPLAADTAHQVGEVLGLVRELKDARALQTQQTTDIARYLNELNTWLEKFVNNSTKELVTLNHRLTSITGPDASEAPEGAEEAKGPQGLADLVADMHAMVTEQKQRAEQEGMVGQRLDTLLTMMGAEQERHASQQNVLEQVASILDRQRQDNEVLLRALATDLTSEIRGERLRFVEAMQQATTMNINIHVEEFKKALGAEVSKSMSELGRMREEKKALEQNISDLFALKAKHGMMSRSNTKQKGPGAAAGPMALSPSGPGVPRGLPVVPGRH